MAWLKIIDKTGESGYVRSESICALVDNKDGITRLFLASGYCLDTKESIDSIKRQIEEEEQP